MTTPHDQSTPNCLRTEQHLRLLGELLSLSAKWREQERDELSTYSECADDIVALVTRAMLDRAE